MHRFLRTWRVGATSSRGVRASHGGGSCCYGAGTLRHSGFSGRSLQGWRTNAVAMACSWVLHGMWNLPRSGTELTCPASAGRLPPSHQESPNHWTTREVPLLFLNDFIEIWLTHKQLYILNVYSLMNLERVIHSWNQHHSAPPKKYNLKSF